MLYGNTFVNEKSMNGTPTCPGNQFPFQLVRHPYPQGVSSSLGQRLPVQRHLTDAYFGFNCQDTIRVILVLWDIKFSLCWDESPSYCSFTFGRQNEVDQIDVHSVYYHNMYIEVNVHRSTCIIKLWKVWCSLF